MVLKVIEAGINKIQTEIIRNGLPRTIERNIDSFVNILPLPVITGNGSMLKLKDIDVLTDFKEDYLLVKFDFEPTRQAISNYSFNIYRSNLPDSDYELIEENINPFEYIDYTVNLSKSSAVYFYKIEIINKLTGEKVF
jgi:hypothetical protein